MFASLKVATVRGIPINLHISILAVVALLLVKLGWLGFPSTILLLGSLLFHELGHALAAQWFGIPVASINVHILGGMALMRPAETPRQELIVAAAGPAASFALGAALGVVGWGLGGQLATAPMTGSDLIAYAALGNVVMGLFNLLPALPMDGGRIFRAALAPRLGHVKATRIAAWLSRAFGALFIIVGLAYGNWGLAVVGGLLFLMVAYEERAASAVEEYRESSRPGPTTPLDRLQWGPPRAQPEGADQVVVDVTGGQVRETREEYVDRYGRRYVVVTKLM